MTTLEKTLHSLPNHKLVQINTLKELGLSLTDIIINTPTDYKNLYFVFLYNGNYDYTINYYHLFAFIQGLKITPIKPYTPQFSHGIQSNETTRRQYAELVKKGSIK